MRISDWSSDVCSSDLLPTGAPSDPASALVNVSIGLDGLVTATFANGEGQTLGKVAMATFPTMSGLRPTGDAHWQSPGDSGPPSNGGPTSGPLGAVRSGAPERAHVDIAAELGMLKVGRAQAG